MSTPIKTLLLIALLSGLIIAAWIVLYVDHAPKPESSEPLALMTGTV